VTARARRLVPIAAAAVALALVLASSLALARPGGGQSFSGGGGGSSGGGGGGGAGAMIEIIIYIIELAFYYPYIVLPLLGGITLWIILSARKQRQNGDWNSAPVAPSFVPPSTESLREIDPEFSQIVFEDFAFRLFSTAHRARTSVAGLATIAPYVSTAAQKALADRVPPGGAPVEQVIVGSQRLEDIDVPIDLDAKPEPPDPNSPESAKPVAPPRVTIDVTYEANVMVGGHTYYSVETWTFARDASRHSKAPGATKDFPCPNCGAPWKAAQLGTQVCASCGQAVDNGRFDWVVDDITLISIDQREPTLTSNPPERGNDLPTVVADDLATEWAALIAADPSVTEASLGARLQLIYERLNAAWAQNELEPARGLVSDGLYDYLDYWISTYKKQHLRNALIDMHLTAPIQLSNVIRDKYYDSVTIRLFASGKDVTINTDTGATVSGSKTKDREYSEYWTLIRSSGRKGPPKTDAVCSNCGAPLKISMAGNCEFCGAHLASGNFDWVLSKIEQDDTYGL
jgi:predicted lipid-binding transport protein (Tim44 family)